MALTKKIQNLIISLDTKNFKLTIMENYGNDYRKVNIEEYACDEELINNKKIFEILNSVLSVYLMDKNLTNPDVYIVLPDYYIAMEHTKLPLLAKSKLKDVLKTELKKQYLNFKELEINSTILQKNKKNIIFTNTILKKDIISDCVSAVKKHNLNLKNITFTANSIANSFLGLGSKLKHTNNIFVNIAENQTQILYSTKDRMLCYNDLPFGTNLLKTEKLTSEYGFSLEKSAEYAVFVSRERAKYKTAKNKQLEENDNYKEQFEKYYEELKKHQTNLGKYIKNEQNGNILAENFETFLKYILQMQKSVVENYNLPEPEYAIINMPDAYDSIFEFYKDFDAIKIRKFTNEITDEFSLTDYLDLYGALYAVAYNKGNNFQDKEKQSSFGTIKMNLKFALENFGNSVKNIFAKKDKKIKTNKIKNKNN